MTWEPNDNLVLSLVDMTGAKRNIHTIIDDINKVVKDHGFKIRSWGDHDSMLRFMRKIGFLKNFEKKS